MTNTILYSGRAIRLSAITACLLGVCEIGHVYGQFSTIINLPPDTAPSFIGSDTQVNVLAGGALGTFVQSGVQNGSTSNIEVNVMGGQVGRGFAAHRGTVVNVSAGDVGDNFDATSGSIINILGGSVDHSLDAEDGALINVTGGFLGDEADVSDAQIVVDGGTVGRDLGLFDDSTLTMRSGEVGGGVHLNNSKIDILGGMTGSVFLTESILNVSGGSAGNALNAILGSEINILGGEVGVRTLVQTSSVLNLESGSLGADAELRGDNVVANISGGTVGEGFQVEFGAVVNLSGGSIAGDFQLNRGTVNFSGGTFTGDYRASDFTQTNIFGAEFFLDGVDITSTLTVGERFRVHDRGVTLSGVLADGSPFSFDLNSGFVTGEDVFRNSAVVYLHLEPGPGDFDGDGDVDGSDFLVWQREDGSAASLAEWENMFGFPFAGDFDGDGDVDADDLTDPIDGWEARFGIDLDGSDFLAWQQHFGNGVGSLVSSHAIPEPSSIVMFVGLVSISTLVRRRSNPI